MSIHATPTGGLFDAEDAYVTALELLKRDLWPIALHPRGAIIRDKFGERIAKGSEPIGEAWGRKRPTEARLTAIYRANPGAGVGIRLGRDGGVIDIEVDGQPGHASLVELLGSEPRTMGWFSRRGPHYLFLYEFRFNSLTRSSFKLAEFPGLELRLGAGDAQLQSACPPTVGLDGRPRRWNGQERVDRLPETAIERILAGPRPKPPPSHVGPRTPTATPPIAYGAVALRQECELVARTAEGSRHHTLRDAALRMASLAKVNALDWHEARPQLAGAADLCGLPKPESEELLDWAHRTAGPRALHIFLGGKGEPQALKSCVTRAVHGEALERAKARIPFVDVPPDLTIHSRLEPVARAVIALHEEAFRRGDTTFFAALRLIQDLAGLPNHMAAKRRLKAISKLGFLSLIEPGIPGAQGTGKSNTWQWHDPPRPGSTVWRSSPSRKRRRGRPQKSARAGG